MKPTEIEAWSLARADEVAEAMGLQVVDLTFRKEGRRWVMRVVLYDPESPISLKELEAFSRRFGDILDAEDPVEVSYDLEVQSPGVGRSLKTPREFAVFQGHMVDLRFYPGHEPREMRARLLGYQDGHLRVEGPGGEERRIPLKDLASCRLSEDQE